MNNNTLKQSNRLLIVGGVLSLIGWPLASQLDWPRFVLVVSLSLAAFMVGCLLAFLFTSYGEEAGTVGKIRDWVVGGITGITLVKASAIKGLLVCFASGPGPKEYALVVAVAITYSCFGFFYMFLQRELILNVLVAESRAERGRLEGTREAGQIVLRLLTNIPADILSGSKDVDVEDTLTKTEIDGLRNQLNSDEVSRFLEQAEQAVKAGSADWQIIALAANLHCYRTFFEGDEELRLRKATLAASWLDRALLINSRHIDFTVKGAVIAAELKHTEETISILEKLNTRLDAPFYVREWLGFYLLDYPDRLSESIDYSLSYHSILPNESDALFNIAFAYGKKYCQALQSREKAPDPEDRRLALKFLKQAIDKQPNYAPTVAEKWTNTTGAFSCLRDDTEFREIVGLAKASPIPAEAALS